MNHDSTFPLNVNPRIASRRTASQHVLLPHDSMVLLLSLLTILSGYLWWTYSGVERGFDPRLVPALWFRYITVSSNISSNAFFSSSSLPFEWSSLLGLRKVNCSCTAFADRYGIQTEQLPCENVPYMRFYDHLNLSLSSLDHELVGAAYMANAPLPAKVVFVAREGIIELATGTQKLQINCSDDYLDIRREWNQAANILQPTKFVSQPANSEQELWKSSSKASCSKKKYFHEVGSHQDWRFFRSCDHKPIIHRMARAWFRFAREAGIDTWLAHGLALGWYWNRMNLPWDNDIDVQVSFSGLEKLVQYNQSIVFDVHDTDSVNFGVGGYLVDVNSNVYCRENDLHNVIDARFIDIFSGYFVDITALTYVPQNMETESEELSQVLEPSYVIYQANPTHNHKRMYSSMAKTRNNLIANHLLLYGKDHHFYTTTDILPLQKTMFEGVVMHVPKGIESMLKREYSKGFLYRRFEGHSFELGVWKTRGEDVTKFQPLLNAKQLKDVPPVWRDPWVLWTNSTLIKVT